MNYIINLGTNHDTKILSLLDKSRHKISTGSSWVNRYLFSDFLRPFIDLTVMDIVEFDTILRYDRTKLILILPEHFENIVYNLSR